MWAEHNKTSLIMRGQKIPQYSFIVGAYEVKADYSSGFFKKREVTDCIRR